MEASHKWDSLLWEHLELRKLCLLIRADMTNQPQYSSLWSPALREPFAAEVEGRS